MAPPRSPQRFVSRSAAESVRTRARQAGSPSPARPSHIVATRGAAPKAPVAACALALEPPAHTF
eukprot:7394184-Pyramimonas_sp.AAC.1